MLPTHIFEAIQPDITDSEKQSVIYTFTSNDMIDQTDESIVYRFPYSPCTFWTHFRLIPQIDSSFTMDVVMTTEETTQHTIVSRTGCRSWHDTHWPLPSLDSSRSGLYLQIYAPHGKQSIHSVHLLGWIDLFPAVPHYHLYGINHICQFQMIQYYYKHYHRMYGSIHRIQKTITQSISRPALEWEALVPTNPIVAIRPLSSYLGFIGSSRKSENQPSNTTTQ